MSANPKLLYNYIARTQPDNHCPSPRAIALCQSRRRPWLSHLIYTYCLLRPASYLLQQAEINATTRSVTQPCAGDIHPISPPAPARNHLAAGCRATTTDPASPRAALVQTRL